MRRAVGYARVYRRRAEIDPKWVLIPGNTYSIKDSLKSLGCKFGERNGVKGWFSDPDSTHMDEINDLVKTLPPAPDYSTWVPLTGKTFEIKQSLKEKYGARWNSQDKVWIVHPDKAKDAQDYVNFVTEVKRTTNTIPGFHCEKCGATPASQKGGRMLCDDHIIEELELSQVDNCA
tara:strand:+ start:773 stop:1297 length:525 start_codon:yes stop_codon:yes gene_type:complete